MSNNYVKTGTLVLGMLVLADINVNKAWADSGITTLSTGTATDSVDSNLTFTSTSSFSGTGSGSGSVSTTPTTPIIAPLTTTTTTTTTTTLTAPTTTTITPTTTTAPTLTAPTTTTIAPTSQNEPVATPSTHTVATILNAFSFISDAEAAGGTITIEEKGGDVIINLGGLEGIICNVVQNGGKIERKVREVKNKVTGIVSIYIDVAVYDKAGVLLTKQSGTWTVKSTKLWSLADLKKHLQAAGQKARENAKNNCPTAKIVITP